MPSVVHVVTTGAFAGVERYVCNVARETAAHGWDVAVVGGHPEAMRAALGDDVRWEPGATASSAARSLLRLGRRDICHAHMTIAEAVSVAMRRVHRAPVVSTRHFAQPRGRTLGGRLMAPRIASRVTREIAMSEFVARRLEREPDAVVPAGVPASRLLWKPSSRVVLVLQRLEPEKDTLTALRAWRQSRLAEDGWTLRVVGDGSERPRLEAEPLSGVTFVGFAADVAAELESAGLLLAPAHAEGVGLAALEAMAAGVPVVACAAGGYLETVGLLDDARLFAPGDADAAAAALRSFVAEQERSRASDEGRRLVAARFAIDRHVDQLLAEYELARAGSFRELVVCSLEPWDDVWRRNQFLVDELMRRHPDLRVLFVEPPADPLFDLTQRRRPRGPARRALDAGRLHTLRPLKPLPRFLGPLSDRALHRQVLAAARRLGLKRPVLWINDLTYAPLVEQTGWPSVYDITDDWLLAPFGARETERLRRLEERLLAHADEVVVCSPALARSRGDRRPVTLVPNAVDVEHFRAPQPRPADLPPSPVAVYVGSLHDARLDVELVLDLVHAIPELSIALIGPDSLTRDVHARLDAEPAVHLLGARPYSDVPAYLQHADVIVVPHRETPFTDSLDPIKAYEALAVETPTVATPVAGFRELAEVISLGRGQSFVEAVRGALTSNDRHPAVSPPSWAERAEAFDAVLARAAGRS